MTFGWILERFVFDILASLKGREPHLKVGLAQVRLNNAPTPALACLRAKP